MDQPSKVKPNGAVMAVQAGFAAFEPSDSPRIFFQSRWSKLIGSDWTFPLSPVAVVQEPKCTVMRIHRFAWLGRLSSITLGQRFVSFSLNKSILFNRIK